MVVAHWCSFEAHLSTLGRQSGPKCSSRAHVGWPLLLIWAILKFIGVRVGSHFDEEPSFLADPCYCGYLRRYIARYFGVSFDFFIAIRVGLRSGLAFATLYCSFGFFITQLLYVYSMSIQLYICTLYVCVSGLVPYPMYLYLQFGSWVWM